MAKIPELEKQCILDRVIEKLLVVAKKQLQFIDNWKLISNDNKSARHFYVFSTVENFWENIKLTLHLGKDNFSHFAFYPVRTCMESFLQFNYFGKQPVIEQDNIAIKELLRSSVRYYQREIEAGGNSSIYMNYYNLYAPGFGYPHIDEIVKDGNIIKTSPGIKRLCQKYLPGQSSILYFLYQALCEGVHGRGIYSAMHKQAKELEEYRRAVMQVYGFYKDILVLIDNNYLGAKFKTEVLSVINKTDSTLQKSVTV